MTPMDPAHRPMLTWIKARPSTSDYHDDRGPPAASL